MSLAWRMWAASSVTVHIFRSRCTMLRKIKPPVLPNIVSILCSMRTFEETKSTSPTDISIYEICKIGLDAMPTWFGNLPSTTGKSHLAPQSRSERHLTERHLTEPAKGKELTRPWSRATILLGNRTHSSLLWTGKFRWIDIWSFWTLMGLISCCSFQPHSYYSLVYKLLGLFHGVLLTIQTMGREISSALIVTSRALRMNCLMDRLEVGRDEASKRS